MCVCVCVNVQQKYTHGDKSANVIFYDVLCLRECFLDCLFRVGSGEGFGLTHLRRISFVGNSQSENTVYIERKNCFENGV